MYGDAALEAERRFHSQQKVRALRVEKVDGTFGFAIIGPVHPGSGGIYVKEVRQGGGGDRAGVRHGDRIVELDGKNTESLDLSNAIELLATAGDSVNMSVVYALDAMQIFIAEYGGKNTPAAPEKLGVPKVVTVFRDKNGNWPFVVEGEERCFISSVLISPSGSAEKGSDQGTLEVGDMIIMIDGTSTFFAAVGIRDVSYDLVFPFCFHSGRTRMLCVW